MREFADFKYFKLNYKFKLLYLLNFLEENPHLSQHKLSKMLGVSSAQVNYYIDEGIRRGWIAKSGESRKRMTYRVTPEGGTAKMTFLMESSVELVKLYSIIKRAVQKVIQDGMNGGLRRVVLFGASETGEVVTQALRNFPVEVVGVVDNDRAKWGQSFGSWTIGSPETIPNLKADGLIITSFARGEEIYGQVRELEERGMRVIRL